MSRIVLETMIHAPPGLCFDLARSVDLHQESTAGTSEKAVAGVTKGMIEMGSSVTWRARHFGVWQELTVDVTAFDPPSMFADEMVRGSFKSMRHVHRFEAVDGGTRMVDEFDFVAPYGVIGAVVDRLVLKSYMKGFLIRRNRFLKREAEKRAEPS